MSGKFGRVAVIGAGIAGLACATTLAQAGMGVTLFEKSRRPGGRVATRRVEGLSFNHGAQFATAHGPDFAALLAGLATEGIAATWPAAGGEGRRNSFRPGMSALPAAMAEQAAIAGADLRTARHAAFLHRADGGWQVRHLDAAGYPPGRHSEPGRRPVRAIRRGADRTSRPSGGKPDRHHRPPLLRRGEFCRHGPVLGGDGAFAEPVDGADVRQSATPPIAWAAREGARPGAEPGADHWVLHASSDWSRAHLRTARRKPERR